MNRTCPWSILIALLVGPAPAQAGDTQDQLARIAREIQAELARRGAPSVAVAVARHGEVLWEGAFGHADREAGVEATPHTLYALASVSKPITATGLMRLVEQGKIDLDGSVNRYLGQARLTAMVGDADAATIRMLANHTAGLTKYYNLFFDDEAYRPTSRVESIRRWGVLMSIPGERHEYSNFGYGVLDYVIEQVAEMPFAEFMDREVFDPLGMESTFVTRPDHLGDRLAVRYMPDGARFPAASSAESGAGAIYSSVHDLIRFGMFHLGTRLPDQSPILKEESLAEMHRATTTARLPFSDVGYGIGWRSWRSALGDFLVVQHTGLMEGATASLTLVPEEGLAIAVLVNEAGFLATAALDIVGRELLGVRNLDAPKREPERSSAAEELWAQLTGEWQGAVKAHDGDVPLRVRIGDRSMRLRFDDQEWTDAQSLVVRGSTLGGTFRGEQKTGSEWRRWPTNLTLTLRKDGDRVTATLFADAVNDPVKGVPFGFTLWVAVKRSDGR